MSSTKPYLIRAIYEWCTDEGFTPYLAVQVDERTRVPREFVRDGQIVLNIGAEATHQMTLGNDEITFQTRFNGASFPVVVPVDAVQAIYARENGQGMAFEASATARDEDHEKVGAGETASAGAPRDTETAPEQPARRGGHLTRIK
ncbi:MAG: ClpXP protease specificity-enhancing factor [Rhodocyclaceae bacterium]|nr:ClpXP protease specificity-enhancing factor [Rhodocyclaceae bacterium]